MSQTVPSIKNNQIVTQRLRGKAPNYTQNTSSTFFVLVSYEIQTTPQFGFENQ